MIMVSATTFFQIWKVKGANSRSGPTAGYGLVVQYSKQLVSFIIRNANN